LAAPHFLVHEKNDSVGVVVVEGVKKGQMLTGWVMQGNKTIKMKCLHAIPIGHKIALSAVKTGSVELSSSKGAISLGNADGTVFTATNSSFSSAAAIDVSTASGASDALSVIDSALAQINSGRADLGAVQNRFESVVSSLQNTAENLSAARSQIQDADFAAETAALTKAQVLQQAGISILAQANAAPQSVLSLLQ